MTRLVNIQGKAIKQLVSPGEIRQKSQAVCQGVQDLV